MAAPSQDQAATGSLGREPGAPVQGLGQGPRTVCGALERTLEFESPDKAAKGDEVAISDEGFWANCAQTQLVLRSPPRTPCREGVLGRGHLLPSPHGCCFRGLPLTRAGLQGWALHGVPAAHFTVSLT